MNNNGLKGEKMRVSGNEAPAFFFIKLVFLSKRVREICMHDMCNQLKKKTKKSSRGGCDRRVRSLVFTCNTCSVRDPASVAKVL